MQTAWPRSMRVAAVLTLLVLLVGLAGCTEGTADYAAEPAQPVSRPVVAVPPVVSRPSAGESSEPATASSVPEPSIPDSVDVDSLFADYMGNPLAEAVLVMYKSGLTDIAIGVMLPMAEEAEAEENPTIAKFMRFLEEIAATDLGTYKLVFGATGEDFDYELSQMENLVTMGCDMVIVVDALSETEFLDDIAGQAGVTTVYYYT